MRKHQSILVFAAASLILATAAVAADGPTREDLSALTLTHGETFVPAPGHPGAAKGYIFRYEGQTFSIMPKPPEGAAMSTATLVETMRKEKTGDLYYGFGGGKPVLMVVSGKARELGQGFLFEFGGKELERPGEWPAADAAKGVPISGWIVNPAEGRVYLIETVDGKLALLRVIARGSGGMLMQWVLSAERDAAAAKFAIPGGMTMAAKASVDMPKPGLDAPEPAAAVAPSSPPVTPSRPPTKLIMPTTRPADPGLVPYLSSWLRQRTALVQERMLKLEREGKPGAVPQDIAEAIRDLGKIRSTEAIPTLIDHITFMDATVTIENDSMVVHPAVGALISIGKPASTSALRAMHDLGRGTSPREAPEYRTILLMNVVIGVEGLDVAEYLFKRELAKADEEHRPYFEQCLRSLKRGDSRP